MVEFLPILELMVIVFFALQLERINHSLKQISKSLHHLSDRIEVNGNSKPADSS